MKGPPGRASETLLPEREKFSLIAAAPVLAEAVKGPEVVVPGTASASSPDNCMAVPEGLMNNTPELLPRLSRSVAPSSMVRAALEACPITFSPDFSK